MKKMYLKPCVRVVTMTTEAMIAYTRLKTDGLDDHNMKQGGDDNGDGEDPEFGDVKVQGVWDAEW